MCMFWVTNWLRMVGHLALNLQGCPFFVSSLCNAAQLRLYPLPHCPTACF